MKAFDESKLVEKFITIWKCNLLEAICKMCIWLCQRSDDEIWKIFAHEQSRRSHYSTYLMLFSEEPLNSCNDIDLMKFSSSFIFSFLLCLSVWFHTWIFVVYGNCKRKCEWGLLVVGSEQTSTDTPLYYVCETCVSDKHQTWWNELMQKTYGDVVESIHPRSILFLIHRSALLSFHNSFQVVLVCCARVCIVRVSKRRKSDMTLVNCLGPR